MNLKETELPGIGKKFVAETRSGDKVGITIHDDGRREMYHYEHDNDEEVVSKITLEDEEARYISAIVGGVAYKPTALENIGDALGDILIEWYKLEPNFKSIGKTIGELRVRQRSNATIIAVIDKNQNKHINPGANTLLTAEATVVVIGERLHQQQIRQILLTGSG